MDKKNIGAHSSWKISGNHFILHGRITDDFYEFIQNRFEYFVDDPFAKITAHIQKPFEKLTDREMIKRFFGNEVLAHVDVLNRMYDEDLTVFLDKKEYASMIILYLLNIEAMFYTGRNKKLCEFKKLLKSKRTYIERVIDNCDARDLTAKVEDIMFSVAHPVLFARYERIFENDREHYRIIEREVREIICEQLMKMNIQAEVQSRTKSMNSLHEKIMKKNILLSQIFDLIGLRILVHSELDCYKVLQTIIEIWPSKNSRIKDYIALPKENGYQGIHTFGMYGKFPLEIQIRTYNMHYHAQYGKAAHLLYKLNR